MKNQRREAWVSYLRVSTPEQAAKDLSLPAQREAISEYAKRNGQVISNEYLEAGCSGTDVNRKAFRRMLEDVFKPGSDIGVIVVHHTSRFTRNATQARVVKEKLRKAGVKVLSVCQELNEDPIGQLIEGIFECIDQYESEVNGMRTRAALREAIRQGFYPGSQTPYGYKTSRIQVRPGLFRSILVPDEDEAVALRLLYQLYVGENGAKSVARELNRREAFYRNGKAWSKDLVLKALEETAVIGTFWWGKRDAKTGRKKDRSEWLSLTTEPIIDRDLYDLAQRLRSSREPTRNTGRPSSPKMLLSGLVRCGKCHSSYTLEGSGKKVKGGRYTYRYYNCRTTCRVGKEACPGGRISSTKLDNAVKEYMTKAICSEERCVALMRSDGELGINSEIVSAVQAAWTEMIQRDNIVARNYLHHLVDHIEVDENRIRVFPRERFRTMAF